MSLLLDITKGWAIPALCSSPEIAGAVFLRPPDDSNDIYLQLPYPDTGERAHPFAFLYWLEGSGEIEGEGIISGGASDGVPPDSYRNARLVIELAYQYRMEGGNDDAQEAGLRLFEVVAQRLYQRRSTKPRGLSHFRPGPLPFVQKVLPDKKIAAMACQWDMLIRSAQIGLAA